MYYSLTIRYAFKVKFLRDSLGTSLILLTLIDNLHDRSIFFSLLRCLISRPYKFMWIITFRLVVSVPYVSLVCRFFV